ncbi:HAD-IIA family hydrolase [Candidatus Parvarchaeota archaeon]|nr:HAD-IIA family hydrolase [Candidatus Parvarchaeota archaeon]
MDNNLKELIKGKELFLLDGDGTLYLWDKPFSSSSAFLSKLIQMNKKFIILSNNDSESKEKRLRFLGKMFKIKLKEEQLLLPNDLVEAFLIKKGIKRFDGVISNDFLGELLSKGFVFDKERPEIVIVGFDVDLTYEKLRRNIDHINNGIKFLLTHNDPLCPYKGGKEIPDAGLIINLITQAVKKGPDYTFGKPFKSTVDYIIKKYKIKRDKMLIIGDRINTDIKMANENRIDSIWIMNNQDKKTEEQYRSNEKAHSIDALYNEIKNL